MPKVSVLMAVYNTPERYLRPAIESILNQTFTDFEFLILDDGSTKNRVQDVVRSYSDPRIIFWENERNLDISVTRNRLIERAQGEYLAVKDSDDISLPNRLQVQVDFLDANPEVGVLGSAIEKIPKKRIRICPESNAAIEEALMYECSVEHPVAMIRRSVLLESGVRYNEAIDVSGDHQIWCDLIGKTMFRNLPDVLLQYRVHKENVTHARIEAMKLQDSMICMETRKKHPDIWARAQENVIREEQYKLFGAIPLMKIRWHKRLAKYLLFGAIPLMEIHRHEKRAKYLLFGAIPLLTYKTREDIFGKL